MTDNIYELFPNKDSAQIQSLSKTELENFKSILLNSVGEFQSMGVMEKYDLYKAVVSLAITSADIIAEAYGIE